MGVAGGASTRWEPGPLSPPKTSSFQLNDPCTNKIFHWLLYISFMNRVHLWSWLGTNMVTVVLIHLAFEENHLVSIEQNHFNIIVNTYFINSSS